MQHPPRSLMLFAAGFGTRMGALTKDRPKPLVKVAGKALIDHALALVDDVQIDRIVVNTHYRGDMIVEHLSGKPILFSDEADKILETGGGLKNALNVLGKGPVLVLNTDAVWQGPNPLRTLQNTWNGDEMDALVLLIPKSSALGHKGAGDFICDPDGRLMRGPGDVYVGASILAPERLADIKEDVFSLNKVWDLNMADRRLFGCSYSGKWCDVGTPAGIKLAEDMLGYVEDV